MDSSSQGPLETMDGTCEPQDWYAEPPSEGALVPLALPALAVWASGSCGEQAQSGHVAVAMTTWAHSRGPHSEV